MAEFKEGIYPLDAIEKKNDERIHFTDGLRGTEEIENRYQDFQKARGKGRKKTLKKKNPD